MTLRLCGVLAVAVLLPACNLTPPDPAAESARLRASFAKHRPVYLEGLAAENRLLAESLQWLRDPSRRDASCRFVDPWARVYFNPREIHAAIRFDEYRSPQVRETHARILERLKRRYFTLHDYQRYAQYACEKRAGKLAQLDDFLSRLETHPPATDEVTPLLDALPR
jgi:hypothetical protein